MLHVRYRVDGLLQDVMTPAKKLEPAIVSRLKIMANLDIAERRLPQDGRIKFREASREIDFRVSIIPALFGESVVLRILDKSALQLDMAQLGFDPRGLEEFQKAIKSPHGMIVVTGPTGSGKTTTLYSALSAVNSPDIHVLTLEDPVEYNLPRVNQVQVNEECKRAHEVDESTLVDYGYVSRGVGKITLYKGRGCAVCTHSGLKGRVAIYEIMPITREIKALVAQGAPTAEICKVARDQGM